MTNIKVTVEYEVPKTNKFDALMAEYEIAKKIADETESYYKPLAYRFYCGPFYLL